MVFLGGTTFVVDDGSSPSLPPLVLDTSSLL